MTFVARVRTVLVRVRGLEEGTDLLVDPFRAEEIRNSNIPSEGGQKSPISAKDAQSG